MQLCGQMLQCRLLQSNYKAKVGRFSIECPLESYFRVASLFPGVQELRQLYAMVFSRASLTVNRLITSP